MSDYLKHEICKATKDLICNMIFKVSMYNYVKVKFCFTKSCLMDAYVKPMFHNN